MTSESAYAALNVFDPIKIDDFFAQYWGRKPLHISRADRQYYASLLTLNKIESLLSSHNLYFPNVQVTQSGASLSVSDYVDDDNKILPLRLIQHYHEGATIVISQAQRFIDSLSDLSRQIHSALQLHCQTNVYLSPPGKQGFNPHFDTHDVLILQISGAKSFNFYSGGPKLPLRSRQFDSSVDKPGDLQQQVELLSGDALYIPRGVMHDALADEKSPSLHLTVGLFPNTVHEVLQQMLEIAAEQDVRYRTTVPKDPRHILDLLRDASTEDFLAAALSQLEDSKALLGVPDCTGLLGNLSQVQHLQLEQYIAVNAANILSVEQSSGSVTVRALGQILELTDPMAGALSALLKAKTMCIRELPGLSDAQKLALCRSLIQQGIADIC